MNTITKTLKLFPTGYTRTSNLSTQSSIANAQKWAGDLNKPSRFAGVRLAVGSVDYTIDTSEIPANATITGVSALVTFATSENFPKNSSIAIYYGMKRASTEYQITEKVLAGASVLLTAENPTLQDMLDLCIRVRIAQSTTVLTNSYIDIYGATVTITYTVPTYSVTVSNTSSVSATTYKNAPETGEDVDIVFSGFTRLTLTDNGTPVTNPVTYGVSRVKTAYPASYQDGGSVGGTNYQNTVGKGSDAASTTGSDYFSTTQGGSGSTWIDYYFDFSEIPSSASITSMTITLKGHCEDISQTREIANIQLYSGTTAKGDDIDLINETDEVFTISNHGSWTRSELDDAKLRFTIGVYGGQITGVTWTVEYEIESYVYTVANITGDRIINISPGSVPQTIYRKVNGVWRPAFIVYKKVGGAWTVQDTLDGVFDANINYIGGGV